MPSKFLLYRAQCTFSYKVFKMSSILGLCALFKCLGLNQLLDLRTIFLFLGTTFNGEMNCFVPHCSKLHGQFSSSM